MHALPEIHQTVDDYDHMLAVVRVVRGGAVHIHTRSGRTADHTLRQHDEGTEQPQPQPQPRR